MTKVQKLIAQILLKLDELEAAIDAADPTPGLELIDTKITALQGKLIPVITEG
jgi:hypothetical protein